MADNNSKPAPTEGERAYLSASENKGMIRVSNQPAQLNTAASRPKAEGGKK